MVDLQTNYIGLKLKNPLIVGSCGLTDSVDKIEKLEKVGAAAVVLKSLFEEEIIMEMEQAMHDMVSRPFVFPETFDYMEQQSGDGLSTYLDMLRQLKTKVEIPVIASINCVSAQKWLYFAEEIEMAGADALELNLFILPTDLNKSVSENEKLYYDFAKLVKEKIKIPLSLKISYYSSNLGGLIQSLDNIGVSGLVLFNRFFNVDFDINSFEITNKGVMSNPTDYYLPLRWIAIMSERVKCSLAASTGVHSSETLIKMILAGADAVQIVSSLYSQGVEHIATLLTGLEEWMEKNGFSGIDDFKGKMSQQKSGNAAAFERIQFMQQFRNFVLNR